MTGLISWGARSLGYLDSKLPRVVRPPAPGARKNTEDRRTQAGSRYTCDGKPFAAGAYGSVWLAELKGKGHERRQDQDSGSSDLPRWRESTFVIKRIKKDCSEHRLSAFREVHFGIKFKNTTHIARFVEHFESKDEIWLVFYNEGRSLRDLVYRKKVLGKLVKYERSRFWSWLRKEKEGKVFMRGLWRDILKGLHTVHSAKTTHRDIKPGNIFIHQDKLGTAVIGDFGSAVDKEALKKFYSIFGPSKSQETLDYAPPEVVFGEQPYSLSHPASYDIWSTGVVFLEMFLGRKDVFALDPRVAARLDANSGDTDSHTKKLRHLLKAFMETCIYEGGFSETDPGLSMRAMDCTRRLSAHVKRLDPLGEGLDATALDLISRLLQWNPRTRITPAQALKHMFFNLEEEEEEILTVSSTQAFWELPNPAAG